MGFEADITQAIGGTGNQSQIILGEKPRFKGRRLVDVSEPIKVDVNGEVTGGDFPKFQPAISGVDLAFLGALIESGVFTGSRARAGGYPGGLAGQGGFVAGSSPLVTPLLVRNLMQDKNPRYHILGGTGKVLPSAVTIVDAQSLAGSAPKTVADDLTSTTNVVRLKITPKDGTASTVNVVDDQALAGAEPKTIANDLSEFGLAFTITVTPDNTADLDDAAVPGEIIIKSLDEFGDLQTVTLSFANGVKTDAQNPTERFTEITEVTATGWSAGNVSITVELAGEVTLGDGVEVASVRVEGIDNWDREIGQTLYWDEDGKKTPQTLDPFFKEVTNVTSSGWAGGDFDITAQDKAVRIYIAAQDQEPVCFLHGEIARGLIPAVIDDMLISQLTLNLSREEIVRFAIQTIYRLELEQQNLSGERGSEARKTDVSGALEYPSEDFFIGFQGVLIIDGVKAPAKTVTLTVNQNWQHVGGLSGEQTDEGLPIAITRETSLSGDFVYATKNNLNADYINNRKFNNLELRLQNKLEGAFPAVIRVLMAKGQLNANPVPTFTGPDEITQSFAINCLPSRIGTADDIKWILEIPEYEPLRVYA